MQEERELAKERKRELTRSHLDFTCEDDYDRRDIYSSQTKREHVEHDSRAARPTPPTAAEKQAAKLKKEWQKAHHSAPGDTEAEWLHRDVERLSVKELPMSGSCEYPNYVCIATPSEAEVQASPLEALPSLPQPPPLFPEARKLAASSFPDDAPTGPGRRTGPSARHGKRR